MQIALCDDNAAVLNTLESYIVKFAGQHDLSITVDTYSDGDSLLKKHREGTVYDSIFMDIYFDERGNGNASLGSDIIREMNLPPSTCVIFLTTSREHAIEAFALGAVHYILKPPTYELVAEAMTRCMEKMSINTVNTLEIKTKSGTVPIPTDNIVYIEVTNKMSTVHTLKSTYQTYSSLDAIYEMLDGKVFLKAQRSYIVNMGYISEFLSDRVILKDKTEITLSRHNKSILKKQYQDFLFHLARKGAI